MDCPACQSPLVVFEYQKIELDYCTLCMGVWFDAGEIELLLKKIGLDPEQNKLKFTDLDQPVKEARRYCPLCNKAMKKVSPQLSSLVLDDCPNGHGIWFDAGEVQGTLKSAAQKDSSGNAMAELLDFLGDALEKDE